MSYKIIKLWNQCFFSQNPSWTGWDMSTVRYVNMENNTCRRRPLHKPDEWGNKAKRNNRQHCTVYQACSMVKYIRHHTKQLGKMFGLQIHELQMQNTFICSSRKVSESCSLYLRQLSTHRNLILVGSTSVKTSDRQILFRSDKMFAIFYLCWQHTDSRSIQGQRSFGFMWLGLLLDCVRLCDDTNSERDPKNVTAQ